MDSLYDFLNGKLTAEVFPMDAFRRRKRHLVNLVEPIKRDWRDILGLAPDGQPAFPYRQRPTRIPE